jgi:hypothetical protein
MFICRQNSHPFESHRSEGSWRHFRTSAFLKLIQCSQMPKVEQFRLQILPMAINGTVGFTSINYNMRAPMEKCCTSVG